MTCGPVCHPTSAGAGSPGSCLCYQRFLFKTIFVLFIAFVFMEEPLLLFPALAYPLGFPFWHGNSDAVQADYIYIYIFSLTGKSAAFEMGGGGGGAERALGHGGEPGPGRARSAFPGERRPPPAPAHHIRAWLLARHGWGWWFFFFFSPCSHTAKVAQLCEA